MINKKDIVGEWSLQDFTIESNDKIRPWRTNAHGLLIYTLSGYMSVSINGDEAEKLAHSKTANSILFYSGRYRIVENMIIHEVINASDANRIGKEMIRTAFQEKDKLILVGKGEFGTATLTWKKISYQLESIAESEKSTSQECIDLSVNKSDRPSSLKLF